MENCTNCLQLDNKQCKCKKAGSDSIFYQGPNLPCTDIVFNDSLTLALQKIDQQLCAGIDQNNFIKYTEIDGFDVAEHPFPLSVLQLINYLNAIPSVSRLIIDEYSTYRIGITLNSVGEFSDPNYIPRISWNSKYTTIYEIKDIGKGVLPDLTEDNLVLVYYQEIRKDVIGTETIIQSGSGINIIGDGSELNPYAISATADGSETKINAGTNITITGNGTLLTPYIINALSFSVPDATSSVKGILKLTNDLGGTADLPTTPTAIHKTGNESGLTGVKTWTNTGATQINGLNLINNGTNTTGVISVTNQNSGYGMYLANNSGVGLRIENFSGTGISFSNSVGTGFALTNSSIGGEGFSIINSNTGVGIKINNTSTGIATIINSSTASTADLIQFTKNNILQTKFNQNGRYSINGGTSLEFLKADGSVDTNVYGIDSSLIHTSGNEVKTGSLTVNSIIKSGGTSSQYLMADGSVTTSVIKTINAGWFSGMNVGTISPLTTGVDIVSAVTTSTPGGTNSIVLVTMANTMPSMNYYVVALMESLSASIDIDNDITTPTFKKISTTQFEIGFRELAALTQNLKVHLQIITY